MGPVRSEAEETALSAAPREFGRWRLLPGQRLLLRDGAPVALGSRAFDMLLALVEANGELVSKDALMRRIWPGTVVEENNLQVQMSALRKALGEDAARLIATIPGRGYRFAGAAAPAVPGHTPGRPVVAVMPFSNLSDDPAQEYFAEGVAEDLTTELSHLRWFSVIARNSAFTYKGRAVDVRHVGRELGADYVLEGSVRKAGGRLRLAVSLCEAATATQVWGGHFDGDLSDIFGLQDRIVEAVTGAVEPSLRSAAAERYRARPTESLGAYDLYLRALPNGQRTRESNEEALRLLRRALELDPGFVAAKGAFAGHVVLRAAQGWAAPEEIREAVRCAREVVEGGGADDPTALAWAGHALAFLGKDYGTGLAAADRALLLAPNSGQILFVSAWTHVYVDDWQTAVARIERAMRLSPVDPATFLFVTALGAAHFVGRHYEIAVEWLRRAIGDRPGFLQAHRLLAASLALLDRLEEAREAVAELLAAAPGYTLAEAAAHSALSGGSRERYLDGLRRAGLPA
jgi:TolB-like protein